MGTARLHLRPKRSTCPRAPRTYAASRCDRLARALMASCTERARAAGATSMWLHTAPFMTAAVRRYEGLGYHYGITSDPLLHAHAYRLDLGTFVDHG